jgi:hypothetical protein
VTRPRCPKCGYMCQIWRLQVYPVWRCGEDNCRFQQPFEEHEVAAYALAGTVAFEDYQWRHNEP